MSHSALSVLPPRGPGGGGPPSYRHGNPRPRGGPFHSSHSHGHGHLAYQPYRLFPRTPSHHQHHHRSSNSSSATGSSPGGSSSNPVSSASGSATGTPEKSGTSATGSTTENPNEYDGRRLRKSLVRKTVDYNAAIIRNIQNRVWQRDVRDRRGLQPDYSYAPDTVPPSALLDNPTNAVTTRYVKSATNKMRCPIFSMAWTPEGRRLVTGASSGEFTLWNGLTFNFETILQAHDSPVRSMVWSHNGVWMVTGDHAGFVKYWQSNMNNVKMFQAHKESVRCLTFSPTDQKFASCSDDGTVRIFDFMTCYEEKVLRGHGADVKCVDWHPHRGILVSGSKDNQQPIKIWDPKAGISLATLHAHKSTVMDARWNTHNGNWLATASRDHLIKLFDIRKLGQELQVFRGHKKEASCLAWHPIHENLFASGGSDGSILFWNVGCEKEVGSIESAHENIIWTLAWHPVGHILCSGSNDHTSKFWTRQKPGDIVRDRTHAFYDYNAGDDNEMEEVFIPGMGPEDKIHGSGDADEIEAPEPQPLLIPGLDTLAAEIHNDPSSRFYDKSHGSKKIPYQKPIPKKFVAIWNDACRPDEGELELEDEQGRMYPQPIFLNKPGGGGSGNPFDTGRSPIEPSVHNSQLPPSAISDFSNPFNPNIGFGPSGVDFGLGGPGGSGSGGQFWDQSGRDRDRGDRERDRDRGRRRGGGGPGGRRGDRGGRWGNKR